MSRLKPAGIAGLLLGAILIALALLCYVNDDNSRTSAWYLAETLVGFTGSVLAALGLHTLID